MNGEATVVSGLTPNERGLLVGVGNQALVQATAVARLEQRVVATETASFSAWLVMVAVVGGWLWRRAGLRLVRRRPGTPGQLRTVHVAEGA